MNYGKIICVWKENYTFFILSHKKIVGYIAKRRWKIKNKYESVIIIGQDVTEEGIKALIARFTDLINSEGKIENVQEVGRKRLAYEVKKNTEGYYVVFNFEGKPELIAELERNYRITDEVIKFITVRLED